MNRPPLHRVTAGPDQAPGLLFLHGFLGSSADGQAMMDAFADRYRCRAVDLPGHGRSLGLEGEAYGFGDVVDALAWILEHDPAPVELVGYSMGGRIALALACRCPENVSGVLLASASAGLETEEARARRCELDERWACRLETEPLELMLQEWLNQPVFASLDRQPALRDILMKERMHGDGIEYARALRGMGLGRQPAYHQHLASLKVPVRWMAGEHDPKFCALARAMAGLSPRADAVIVPDAGHHLYREQPGMFTLELNRWLNRPA